MGPCFSATLAETEKGGKEPFLLWKKKKNIFRYSKQQHGNWAHLKWEPNQIFPQNLLLL